MIPRAFFSSRRPDSSNLLLQVALIWVQGACSLCGWEFGGEKAGQVSQLLGQVPLGGQMAVTVEVKLVCLPFPKLYWPAFVCWALA
jgi:hypothetical protein